MALSVRLIRRRYHPAHDEGGMETVFTARRGGSVRRAGGADAARAIGCELRPVRMADLGSRPGPPGSRHAGRRDVVEAAAYARGGAVVTAEERAGRRMARGGARRWALRGLHSLPGGNARDASPVG